MLAKMVGMFAVFIVCSAAGLIKSAGLAKRVRQLEAIKSAINLISTEIRYFASPVEVIMHKLDSMDEYKELQLFGFCEEKMRQTGDFKSAWTDAITEVRPRLALAKGDYEPLISFGAMLGATDIEGQLSNCGQYMELLSQRLAHAREDQAKRGKMYSSLGVLAGVFLVVLLF